jgi:hypothetical protein
MPLIQKLTAMRKVVRLASTVSTLALMLSATNFVVRAQSGSYESNDKESKSASIEGSWIFTIDGTGAPIHFNSLISFTAGGVVVTSASTGGPIPFYGAWKQKDSNRFHAVFYTFVFDSTGNTVGTGKLNLHLHLTSRNELEGTAVGSACDLQGENCVDQAEFQNTGKRIVLNSGRD